MSYGRAFSLMKDAAGETWPAYARHRFVEQLRDGSLPQEAFLHYLRQDYVFLLHFSRAWALAVVKAETVEEMQLAAASVNALAGEEIKLHVGLCAEAGISEAELFATPERAENLAYTRYVLDQGFSGDFLGLLAALAPCVLGYGEIGARLAAEKTSDTYGDWIGTYSGDDYQGLCKDVGALLDNALERRLGPNYEELPVWSRLCAGFTKATELEVGFWDMGLTP